MSTSNTSLEDHFRCIGLTMNCKIAIDPKLARWLGIIDKNQ